MQTFLIALTTGVLTAAAALAASWLTSQATIRAAEVQVRASAMVQRLDRTLELRRTAYLDLLVYVTELRWRTRDLATRTAVGDETALSEFRAGRNDAGMELARRRYIVHLAGPDSIQECVDRLCDAIDRLADDLDIALQLGDPAEIHAAVKEARSGVKNKTQEFVVQARSSLATGDVPNIQS